MNIFLKIIKIATLMKTTCKNQAFHKSVTCKVPQVSQTSFKLSFLVLQRLEFVLTSACPSLPHINGHNRPHARTGKHTGQLD